MSITIEKARYDCGSGVSPRSGSRWQQSGNKSIGNNNKTGGDVYWGGNAVRAGVTGPSPVRNDSSLVPPIRQTASIFKQPVTVYKSNGVASSAPSPQIPPATTSVVTGDKPKQLIWEKRLEGLRACDASGEELSAMELPRGLKPVLGPVSEGTVVQSVATALHVCQGVVTGQTGPRAALDKNPGVYLDPRQPLVHHISITDDDIRRQEERVTSARRKLQDALNS